MITLDDVEQFSKWYDEIKTKNHTTSQYIKKSELDTFLENNECPVKQKICNWYDSGIGYKKLSKKLGISYTQIRIVMTKYFCHTVRTGRSVVTDELRKTRRENVLGEKSPFFNWTEHHPHLMDNGTKTGVSGFYKRSNGEYVYLRSCYEYIYAKWLDTKGIKWGYEIQRYSLSNGTFYRPDFFIYENGKLKNIVEIKNTFYHDRKLDKVDLFKIEYDIGLSVIFDVKKYIIDSTYHKELRRWKNERLSKADLEKLLS